MADLKTNLERAAAAISGAQASAVGISLYEKVSPEEVRDTLLFLVDAVRNLEQAIRKVHEPGYESEEDFYERPDWWKSVKKDER